MTRPRISRIEVKLFFVVWAGYAVFATPAGGAQPNRYIDLVHSIANEGRFEIDNYHDNTIDKILIRDHYCVAALPGPSIWAVPLYFIFREAYHLMPQDLLKPIGSIQSFKRERLPESIFYMRVDQIEFFASQFALAIFFVGAFSALGVLILFKFTRSLGASEGLALFPNVAYALGTIAFFFSTTFFEQVITGTLAFLVFFMIHVSVKNGAARSRNWHAIVILQA